jgi:hypothetical protein
MLEIVVVCGSEIGDHRPVVVGDDDATPAGGLFFVDAVLDAETGGLDGVVQDRGVFVVADTAKVDYAVGWEHVLRATGGVLGSAAGDQLCGVVVEEVFVDGEVLGAGEDGIVGFELVFVEEGLVTLGLDVWREELVDKCIDREDFE